MERMNDERYNPEHPRHRELMLACCPHTEAVAITDIRRGNILRNVKSGKEYAVLAVRVADEAVPAGDKYTPAYTRRATVEIMGVRNGKNYGPFRWIAPAALRGWVRVRGQAAAFVTPTHHSFTAVVEEGR